MPEEGEKRLTPGQKQLLEAARSNIEQMEQMQSHTRVLIDRTKAILARLGGLDKPKE